MTENGIRSTESGLTASALTLQRRRAVTFGIAAILGVVVMTIDASLGKIGFLLVGCGVGAASAFSLLWLIRRRVSASAARLLDIGWNLLDLLLVIGLVTLTGGPGSPWFVFLATNTAGAALALGGRAAVVFALAGSALHLGLPVVLGQVELFGPVFNHSLVLLLLLYGATYYLIRSFAELQARRSETARMHEAQVRAIDELSRMTTALEQRTRELADAQVRIREADRLKSQFLANMSHELRTPLNSIIGFSEVLLTRLQQEMPPKYLKFLQNINSAGQHLLGIINDILDLSKIEAGNVDLHLEQLSVGSIVEGVCTVMKGTARKHDITLDVQVPQDLPPLEADPVKIKQIIYNLVANAVKFSRDGSTVSITARRVAEAESTIGSEALCISVVDHGIGIDPRFHRLIFEEFVQVDNTPSRLFGGSGLGLALVRRFVELHGGVITLDSALGRGSTFSVTLPCGFKGSAAAAVPRPETLQLPGEIGRRVLVVEDDPTSYEVISRRLTEASFVPVRARSSREAINLARTLRPAAITLDIILPGADGWEVLKSLKADADTADIPVIIVSVVDNRELGMALGAQDYLLKPVDGALLVRRLRELLPRSSGEKQRILLIDDDPTLHEIMEEKLKSSGFIMDHAMSGREGIELVRRQPPVLIVLDLMMQEMDGFEVAKVLREDAGTAEIPIVVFTAKDVNAGDKERLAGKVAALVEKGRTSHSGIVPIIRDVLNRQTSEARRG